MIDLIINIIKYLSYFENDFEYYRCEYVFGVI